MRMTASTKSSATDRADTNERVAIAVIEVVDEATVVAEAGAVRDVDVVEAVVDRAVAEDETKSRRGHLVLTVGWSPTHPRTLPRNIFLLSNSKRPRVLYGGVGLDHPLNFTKGGTWLTRNIGAYCSQCNCMCV